MIAAALRTLAVIVALAHVPAAASAQEWRLGAHAGRVGYDELSTGATRTSSLMLTLNRLGFDDWVGISAGIPVGDDALWGVLAGWKQFRSGTARGALLDLSGHLFVQRDAVTESVLGPIGTPRQQQTTQLSSGFGFDALAGAFAGAGPVRFELLGGAAFQSSDIAGTSDTRVLPTAAATVSWGGGPLLLAADARGWRAPEADYTYAGGSAQLEVGVARAWVSAGSWLSGPSGALPLAGGLAVALGERVELELSMRRNGFDPLYLTTTASSFSIGASVALGPRSRPLAPVPSRYGDGRAIIRLPVSDAPTGPSIAGDFTDWSPQPMRRDGEHWTFDVAVAPGVYSYAFVGPDGEWFVPESVPSRRSDGMGGYVAVLVVPG